MAGWPSLGRVEDRRLAQSLRAGETSALPEIYDFYAPRLFDYCHALVRDEDLAADALHDSLIATQEHIAKLREPERFRSWLYAIVRNECLRLLSDPDRPAPHREASEMPDDAFIDAEERQRREENRRLVQSALGGLAGRHREAIDLSARHDLSAEELGGILGLSSQQATELVADAREELDTALAAAIIARTGRGDCPSVAALVDEQQWPLPADICKKLIRHMESCPTCRDRRRRKVSTTRLMQILPAAAIPADLRMAVLTLAGAGDQHENRTRIAQRAEPFDVWGWPASLDRARPSRGAIRSGTPKMWPAIGAAACVILLVGAIFMLTGGGDSRSASDKVPGTIASGGSEDPTDLFPSDSTAPSPSAPTKTPSPTPTKHTPTPKPTTTKPKPPPTHKPTPKPPAPGTLSVSTCTINIGQNSCDLDITAQGGTVHWAVTGTDPGLAATGTSNGTLAKGQTTQVTISHTDNCTSDGSGRVSFSPGGGATVEWKCLLG